MAIDTDVFAQTKQLLDMNDFVRLSSYLCQSDSQVETTSLMDAYLELLRAPDSTSALNPALCCLRDLIGERCGVASEVVQISFEDFIAHERREHNLAATRMVFAA